MGKKKGKKKLPPYWSEEEDCAQFGGLKARDLIKTPLGIIGTILGVKYETKQRGEPGTGTMWVQYPNGFLSPLVKNRSGYQRLSDGDHLWRDINEFNKIREQGEELRAMVDDHNDKYVAELVAAWEKKNKKKKKKKA